MPLIVKYKSIATPFVHPFTISKGTKTHQPALIVSLECRGYKGYGEAPAISYYNITVEQMIEELERKKKMVEQFAFTDPERYWHYLHHLFPKNPFLVCALDMAAWDMMGKMRKKPLDQLWGLNSAHIPLCDYTIGVDSIENMVAKMQAKPWPIYKIKVGVEGDIEMVKALRTHTDAVFRADANGGWTLEQALDKIPQLKSLGVEFIEQPLAKDDWEGMKVLYEKSPMPLIADESCVAEQDVEKCAGYFHGINIKLTKCSGLTPARRMIEKARLLNLSVMLGSMNETSLGSAAIGRLAPLADYLDMDGPLLLAEDIAQEIQYQEGKVSLSQLPGLGVELNESVSDL